MWGAGEEEDEEEEEEGGRGWRARCRTGLPRRQCGGPVARVGLFIFFVVQAARIVNRATSCDIFFFGVRMGPGRSRPPGGGAGGRGGPPGSDPVQGSKHTFSMFIYHLF